MKYLEKFAFDYGFKSFIDFSTGDSVIACFSPSSKFVFCLMIESEMVSNGSTKKAILIGSPTKNSEKRDDFCERILFRSPAFLTS